ncbi:putative ethanolamine utilization protein EutJ [Mycobacterium sp. MAC_080597_8934]|nr:putative ethanolamine utilization protein EutJ [Mycobacterium intracellulare MIN_061107_1834]ETZ40425.1 putative ethanolamine utilization protein EutJ [Mycobacterium intracellulare MIN_052511_1280]ETZ44634.1 putative ethanolamine utilization protein EutJ [Mycobacterium avium MAV_120809_2495]ETZ59503.1 putative ethanolamine utilization protein EutJ [Mycobacterium sp. MAC_080597_8934]ETZ74816.1 putative ethanolamine utilization protein EutJ [Mycobacterium sp. MAC_011194_8550]
MSVLTTAVQEQHNGAGSVVPVAIRREGDAVCGAESLERNGHRVRSPL